MTSQLDPGWKPAFRLWGQSLLPWRAFRAKKELRQNGLLVLRVIWLSLLQALFLFLFVLSFLALDWSGSAGWWPLAVTGVGLASLWDLHRIRQNPLDVSNESRLRDSYLKLFYKCFARAEVPALFSFVGVFVTNRRWLYVAGLAFGVIGMAMIAPSEANLARHQQRINAKGSPLSLIEALRELPRAKPAG